MDIKKYLTYMVSIPGLSLLIVIVHYICTYIMQDDDDETDFYLNIRNSTVVGVSSLCMLYLQQYVLRKYLNHTSIDTGSAKIESISVELPSGDTDKILGLPSF